MLRSVLRWDSSRWVAWMALGAWGGGFVSLAGVVAIPGLVGTGVGGDGRLLAAGKVDPHWRLVESADSSAPGPSAYVVQEGFPIPPWVANGPASMWIGPKADQGGGNRPGDYVYRLRFDLSAFEPETAVITGRWSSDNSGVEVRLNGVATGIQYDGNFQTFSEPFTIRTGFQAGPNTLDFVVNNAGSDVNPTGFRCELSGTADPVAPPGTPVTILRSPTNVVVGFKESAVFDVVAYGSKPLTYQWRFEGQAMAGATNVAVGIPYADARVVGDYDVVVRNGLGAVTSRVARLEIVMPSPAERTYEPRGPSSRRTGVVISEIQYHPAERPDRKDLEFIELHNTHPYFEDLSGWRLTGEISYEFPQGTLLSGGGYIVVASAPADLREVSGATNVVGAYSGRLADGGGTVRVRKRSGAVVLEVGYGDRWPWPVSADGAGHSLVLARPSWGEGDPAAWAASAVKGGSPGSADPWPSGDLEQVVLNEVQVRPSAGGESFVEVFNLGARPVDLGRCRLLAVPGGEAYVFPAPTVVSPRGWGAVDVAELPFLLSPAGGRLMLENPEGTRVLDAVRFGAVGRGESYGRLTDGGDEWGRLSRGTPRGRNADEVASEVVINEILYHPVSGVDGDEFMELFNPGGAEVRLGGWRLTEGVEFEFPEGAVLAPGGYLVVARDRERFLSVRPGFDAQAVVGDYAGGLSDRGERVTLIRPESLVAAGNSAGAGAVKAWVEVDTVAYGEGGRWGRWADGLGSSLELVDWRNDNRRAPSWADSVEAGKAGWTLVETTGVVEMVHPGVSSSDRLQLMLLGPGEVWVDDVQVLVGTANRVANGTFEGGVSGWVFQGTHEGSGWEVGGGRNSARCLRVSASERGDHVANRVFVRLQSSIAKGTRVTLRLWARWRTGHPELLVRLRGGGLETVGRPEVPLALGTPGMANSQARANAGPAITAVQHRPVLPRAGEPIRVMARVADADEVASVVLRYRVDPSATVVVGPMTDDGVGPDEAAGDGVYTGTIPGQATGRLVAFSVGAQDGRTPPATSEFPAGAPVREGLVRVGETAPAGSFGQYRLWLTRAAHDRWASREKMSNADVDATFVYGDHRAIYNVGAHYSGSSYTIGIYDSPTGALCGYDLNFPDDDRFLGETHVTLDWPIRDDTNQREQLMYWFLEQYGLPNMYRRYVHLWVNGVQRGVIYDDVQQPGADTVEEWFAGDADGVLLKTDCWNEFDDGGSRIDPCILNTLENLVDSQGQRRVARYRWNWRPRAVRGSASDFTELFGLVDAMNATTNYLDQVRARVDVEHWMRTFAMNDLASFWDAFGNGNAKNTFLYKPDRDGWKLMCWDFDVGLGVFNDPPTASLFDVNDPTLVRMYQTPAFVRLYWAALQEALDGFFQAKRIDPILDAKYAAFQAAGISLSGPAAIKNWIGQRRSYLQTQLNTVRASFAITQPAAVESTSVASTLELVGTAPVSVREIWVNGVPYPLHWETVTRWRLRLALQPGTNNLSVIGMDRLGHPVAGALASRRVEYTGSAPPLPPVRINEWMAANRASQADPADGEYADWFELHNASDLPIPLAGYWLTDDPSEPAKGLVPAGVYVPARGYLLVWADGHPEQTTPGGALHVAFSLRREGETLMLSDPTGRVVDRVDFGEQREDRSEGRWPDGVGEPFFPLQPATPGQANQLMPWVLPPIRILEVQAASGDGVRLTWTSLPGRRYAVGYTDAVGGTEWRVLEEGIVAQGDTVTILDPDPPGANARFYRVLLEGADGADAGLSLRR